MVKRTGESIEARRRAVKACLRACGMYRVMETWKRESLDAGMDGNECPRIMKRQNYPQTSMTALARVRPCMRIGFEYAVLTGKNFFHFFIFPLLTYKISCAIIAAFSRDDRVAISVTALECRNGVGDMANKFYRVSATYNGHKRYFGGDGTRESAERLLSTLKKETAKSGYMGDRVFAIEERTR